MERCMQVERESKGRGKLPPATCLSCELHAGELLVDGGQRSKKTTGETK